MDKTITKENGVSFVQGINKLDGQKALELARECYAFASGDRARGEHQMRIITAVIGKVTSPVVLTNYSKLLDSLKGCFETDMSYDKISELVRMQLSSGAAWDIQSMSVTGTGAQSSCYSLKKVTYVMIPDMDSVEKAKQMIRDVEQGK